MSKLYFFRHAQASYGAENYDKLSPKGEQQAAELGNYLVNQGFHFDKIFVGPLVRQRHTCQIVADIFKKNNRSFPEPIVLQELKEHSAPEAMRKAIPELKKIPQVKKWFEEIEANPKISKRNGMFAFQYFMRMWTTGELVVEGIETWQEFLKEVRNGLDVILEKTGKGEQIAAFTSGGTISAIVAESLGIKDGERIASLNFSIMNTSFTTFYSSPNQFNLGSFNELPHLREEMRTFV